eukprot:COSAG05_NODE_16485_length_345_cov_0.634146_2_plen_22_part_01
MFCHSLVHFVLIQVAVAALYTV